MGLILLSAAACSLRPDSERLDDPSRVVGPVKEGDDGRHQGEYCRVLAFLSLVVVPVTLADAGWADEGPRVLSMHSWTPSLEVRTSRGENCGPALVV